MRKIQLRKSTNDRLPDFLVNDLNESQRAAATAPDGANLILAGPGSGKTRVITYRVAYLIAKGVAPESILLVTFTRRAAREMVHRLESLIGTKAQQVWAGTFHHIGNRLLRQSAELLGYSPNFTILDSADQADLIQLAMNDAGVFGSGKMSPKPAAVHHLISHAANLRRPIAQLVHEKMPQFGEWAGAIEQVARVYASRKLAANSMDYDDLLNQWSRLLNDFPEQREVQGRRFRHILIDETQDTNAVQVAIVEAIAAAGSGNLTAVGDDAQSIYRFRGANYDNILKFPERHPGARIFHLDINYRSTPEIVAFTNASIAQNTLGFAKNLVSARESGMKPVAVPAADVYEEADFLCQQILDLSEQGVPLGKMAVLYRNHHDSVVLQGELVSRGITYTVRSGVRFFEQAHIKDVLAFLRIVGNPRDESAWRRLFLLLPGVGPAKASALSGLLMDSADPHATFAGAEAMALVPTKSKGFYAGFVADVRKIQASKPETDPSAAISAILQGGYPATVRARYENPDNRLADIEQLGALAASYPTLERMIAELLLAGDIYGMDSAGADDPADTLVLSTIHQAKGLEWSRVFIPRLVDDSFPHYRATEEPGGEDEERRIFYVGISRAMDELYLTYPLTMARGGRGPTVLTKPSRFLKEIAPEFYEDVILERETDPTLGG